MNEKRIALNKVKMRILLLLLIIFGGHVQAQNPDSSLTRWLNGKKYILHRISPKETYSSLSRQYSVPVSEIQAANPKSVNLKIGETVYIPARSSTPAKSAEANTTPSTPKPAPVANIPIDGSSKQTHTVKKGETLYGISKMYSMSVDDLKQLNALSSNAVSIGQKLKVVSALKSVPPIKEEVVNAVLEVKTAKEEAPVQTPTKTETVPDPTPVPKEIVVAPVVVESTKSIDNKTIDTTELPKVYTNPGTSRTSVIEKDPKSGVEVEKVTEIGVATWIAEGELNQNKFYALHRTAPVGSIIKVTNRMNNNSVFVKVVGILPDTGDNNAAIIKITQAAAQRIGAIDQKFTAELSYGLTR
jgi:LysM repeat protein